jgi:hypothetical protein
VARFAFPLLFACCLSGALVAAAPARAEGLEDGYRMPQPDRLTATLLAFAPSWLPREATSLATKLLAGRGRGAQPQTGAAAAANGLWASYYKLPVLQAPLLDRRLELGLGVGTSAQERQIGERFRNPIFVVSCQLPL